MPGPARRRRSRLPPSPFGTVAKMQVRSRDPLSSLTVRLEQGVEDAAGQKRSLDGPGRLAGEHHLRDAVNKHGEVSAGPGFLGPELPRLDPPGVSLTPRPAPCVDSPVRFNEERTPSHP